MKLDNTPFMTIRRMIALVAAILIAALCTHLMLRHYYGEIFEQSTELDGEKGTGKLMQREDGLYTYRVFDNTNDAIIVYYNGAMINHETEVIIPEKIDGYNVVILDEAAISYNEYIEKLVLPKSLKSIRRCIGDKCPNLKEIIFDGDTISVDDEAFKYSKDDYYKGEIITKRNNELWKYAEENGIKVSELMETK